MLQYISDIHLEYLSSIPYIKKTAENICLVGDIGHPGTPLFNTFLKRCSQTYKNVFLIYGNHEYYSVLRGKHKKIETMQEKEEYAKFFPKNVHFLNNSCVYFNKRTHEVKRELSIEDRNDIDYVRIIGSTLWSNQGVKANNFKNIFVEKDKLLTFEYQSQLFNQAKYYIINELYKENISTVLLTHYTTNMLCNGIYLDNKDTNHIKEIFLYKHLVACINGHTHSSINLIAPGTSIKLLSNCYGYKNENQNIVRYDENIVLNLHEMVKVSFYGLYGKIDINPIEILYKVMTRPNQVYNIGPVNESTPFIVTTINKDNTIIYANKEFEKLSGYTLNEIRGKNCRFLQSPLGEVKKGSTRDECDNNLLFKIKTKIGSKEECQFVTYNYKKNGNKFINVITVIPIEINSLEYYVGFQSDITDEIYKFNIDKLDQDIIDSNVIKYIKDDNLLSNIDNDTTTSCSGSDSYSIFSNGHQYESIRHNNIRYKHFFDTNLSFLCIVDINGCFKKINNTFLYELGYNKSEMINNPLIHFIYKEDIASTIQDVEDINVKKQIECINRYSKKDGSLIKIKWACYLRGDVIYCNGQKLT
jgi:PAS domain S-box-containing protein